MSKNDKNLAKKYFEKAAIYLSMAMAKGDEEMLTQMGHGSDDNSHVEQRNLGGGLLQQIHEGDISEEHIKHHYRIVDKAEKKFKKKYQEKFKKKWKKIGDKEDSQYPIDIILDLDLSKGLVGEYSPVRLKYNTSVRYDLSEIADHVHVKNMGDKKLFEFYVGLYEYNHIYENIKKGRNILGTPETITYDDREFNNAKGEYIIKTYRYNLNYYKTTVHNGNFIVKYVSDPILSD